MIDFVSYIGAWADGWNAAEPSSPILQFSSNSHLNYGKRAAWLLVENTHLIAQITIWDTGECKLEAVDTTTQESILREHRDLHTLEDLRASLKTLLQLFPKD